MGTKDEKAAALGGSLGTYIGRDAEFEGHLKLSGTIRVDGFVKGEISGDATIIIGKQGRLECNIHASNVIVFGEVRGDITASNRVDIQSAGKVFGDIETPTIGIEQGVIFEGNCKTHQAVTMGEAKRTAVASPVLEKQEPHKPEAPEPTSDAI